MGAIWLNDSTVDIRGMFIRMKSPKERYVLFAHHELIFRFDI